jgi:predicted ATPase/DNA-binding CsgD family transcriptional regulator
VNRRSQAVAAARSLGLVTAVQVDDFHSSAPTLTNCEAEVLQLLDAGLSNQAIAERLGISYNTVAEYIRQISTKLNVSGRTEAVAVAHSMGLLGDVEGKSRSKLRHKLPIQSPPFIGRETELAEIKIGLEQKDCRLLTLLGPGGSGKTRLGIEAARAQLGNFSNGVFFVNLAPVQKADKIPATIASVLGFSFYEDIPPFEQLLDYLRNKELLLLLDNFEHLLVGTNFIIEIIQIAPKIKLLATSRTSLALSGEHIYPVLGMAFPDEPPLVETISTQYSTVKLFETRARHRQPNFRLTDENIFDIVRICKLVVGMPLGVILAANWVRALSPGEIADELAQDLALLETELRDIPSRQRTMRNAFNYSWRLLSQKKRGILAALSVFRGGFTRKAAVKVTGATLPNLKSLIDQSMLYSTSTNRYEVHELLRQFAAEQLGVDPNIESQIRAQHGEFYIKNLTAWEYALQGSQQLVAQKEMVLDIDNIRAAWSWAGDEGKHQLLLEGINGLCIFYERNRQRVEGEIVCHLLLERLEGLHSFKIAEPGSIPFSRSLGSHLQARLLAWGVFSICIWGILSALEPDFEDAYQYSQAPNWENGTPFRQSSRLCCITCCFGSDSKSRNRKIG